MFDVMLDDIVFEDVELDDSLVDVGLCLVCGDVIDYCQGHGPLESEVWDLHDEGDHHLCNEVACAEAS